LVESFEGLVLNLNEFWIINHCGYDFHLIKPRI
jgi:hypothetical protein